MKSMILENDKQHKRRARTETTAKNVDNNTVIQQFRSIEYFGRHHNVIPIKLKMGAMKKVHIISMLNILAK